MAEVERILLCLLASLRVNRNLAYRHPAIVAGVGTQGLKARVVRLNGVVVILGGWGRVGCARLLYGHEVPLRGPGPGVLQHRRGHFFMTPVLSHMTLLSASNMR